MLKNEVNKKLIERVSKSEKLMYVAKFLGKYKDIYCGKNKNGYVLYTLPRGLDQTTS